MFVYIYIYNQINIIDIIVCLMSAVSMLLPPKSSRTGWCYAEFVIMYVYMYVYIYIYTFMCVERERCVDMLYISCCYCYCYCKCAITSITICTIIIIIIIIHLCVYIYIYIHTYRYVCRQSPRCTSAARPSSGPYKGQSIIRGNSL